MKHSISLKITNFFEILLYLHVILYVFFYFKMDVVQIILIPEQDQTIIFFYAHLSS